MDGTDGTTGIRREKWAEKGRGGQSSAGRIAPFDGAHGTARPTRNKTCSAAYDAVDSHKASAYACAQWNAFWQKRWGKKPHRRQ